METFKVRIIKNRRNKYNIYADVDGESMPIGQTLHGEDIKKYAATYKICEWDTREDAIKYIESKEGRLILEEGENE